MERRCGKSHAIFLSPFPLHFILEPESDTPVGCRVQIPGDLKSRLSRVSRIPGPEATQSAAPNHRSSRLVTSGGGNKQVTETPLIPLWQASLGKLAATDRRYVEHRRDHSEKLSAKA